MESACGELQRLHLEGDAGASTRPAGGRVATEGDHVVCSLGRGVKVNGSFWI